MHMYVLLIVDALVLTEVHVYLIYE